MSKFEKSLKELQAIGDEILKKFNNKNPYYEVDIDYIIEKGYVVQIEPVALIGRLSIEAFSCLEKKILYVDLNILNSSGEDLIQERRFRFTLAEELAHIILHGDIFKGVSNFDDWIKADRAIPEEEYNRVHNNARELAGILLMPKYPFINRAIEIRDDLCRLKGLNRDKLKDEDKAFIKAKIVKILMDDFNVNEKAVKIRIERIENSLHCLLFEMSLNKSYLKKKKP